MLISVGLIRRLWSAALEAFIIYVRHRKDYNPLISAVFFKGAVMKRAVFVVLASWAVLFGSVSVSQAQTDPSVPSYPVNAHASSSPSPAVQPTPKPKENFFKDILHDQK